MDLAAWSQSTFQCSLGSADLCFNGGFCNLTATSGVPICICPPGWSADMWFFHNPNCAQPVGAMISYVVIDCTVNLLGALWLVHKYRLYRYRQVPTSRNEKLRFDYSVQLLRTAIVALVAYCGVSIGLISQNGYYEVSAAFMMCFVCLQCIWSTFVSRILFLPFFVTDYDLTEMIKVNRRGDTVCALFYLCSLPSMVIPIVTCRTDERAFNYANMSLLFCCWVLGTTYSINLYIILKSLRKQFQKGIPQFREAFPDIHKKLDDFQRAVVIVGSSMLPILVWPIVFLVLGSAPFYWVTTICQAAANSLSITYYTHVLVLEKTSPSSSSSSDPVLHGTNTQLAAQETLPQPGTVLAGSASVAFV